MRPVLAAAVFAAVPAPASAQPDTRAVDGWEIKRADYGCSASYAHEGAQPFVLSHSRSYRGSRQPIYRFAAELGAETVTLPITTGSIRVELFTSGDPRSLGRGRASRLDEQGGARIEVELGDFGAGLLSAGLGSGAALRIVGDNGPLARFPADRVRLPIEGFEQCFAHVGDMLKSARPDPPDDFFPRGPVPRTNPASWVTTQDYPSRSLRMMSEGTVVFTLFMNEYGLVERCRLDASSGDSLLDERTCRSLQRRARFYPARNEADEAVASTWSSAVRWMLPE